MDYVGEKEMCGIPPDSIFMKEAIEQLNRENDLPINVRCY